MDCYIASPLNDQWGIPSKLFAKLESDLKLFGSTNAHCACALGISFRFSPHPIFSARNIIFDIKPSTAGIHH